MAIVSEIQKIIFEHKLIILAFGYFLLIALLRASPYWQYGIEFTWWMGVLFALIPIAPGMISRRIDWYVSGYFVAILTPYQSGIILVSIVTLLWAPWTQHTTLKSINIREFHTGSPFFWLSIYLAYVSLQWLLGFGTDHNITSIVLSFLTILATPLALIILAWSVAKGRIFETMHKRFYHILIAEAVVLLAYPLIIGEPLLLAAAVNGVLKPLYTVLNLPWDFPWFDPDWNPGSISIVNYSAIVMMMGAVYYGTQFLKHRNCKNLIIALLFLFTSFLGENAIATGAAIGAVIVVFIIVLLNRKFGEGLASWKLAILTVFLISGLAGFAFLTYIGPGKFSESQKGKFYSHTLDVLSQRPVKLLFGYGLGGYGSRIAQAKLPNDLYEVREKLYSNYSIAFPLEVFQETDFIRDFERVRKIPAEWIGSSQGMMTSGIIALVAENGVIGLILLMLVFASFLKPSIHENTLQSKKQYDSLLAPFFGICFLLFLAVFYNYPEIPTIIASLTIPFLLQTNTNYWNKRAPFSEHR